MEAFFASMRKESESSKRDYQRAIDQKNELDKEYRTIRSTVKTVLRSSSLKPIPKKRVYKRKPEASVIPNDDEYEPASKYPVPIDPIAFKPHLHSNNPERITKIGTYRNYKSDTDPVTSQTPDIDPRELITIKRCD